MLYEENNDVTCISRWARIPTNIFIKVINMYNKKKTEEMNK